MSSEVEPTRVSIDSRTSGAVDLIGDRWSLLLLVVLDDQQPARFSDVVARLALSRRVLSQRLREFAAAGLVRSEQYNERPPRSHYLLTPRGVQARRLAMALVHVAGGGQMHAAEALAEAQAAGLGGAAASAASGPDAAGEAPTPPATDSHSFRDIKPAPYVQAPATDHHPSDRLLAADTDYAWTIYQQALAVLVRYDDQYGTDLVATLQAFLDCDASVSAAAERLYAHRHTVRYRLDRVHELTGLDIDVVTDRERLQLGLRAMTMFHRMGRQLI